MQRLTGLDDGFLWMETPTSPMHVASLIVVDGASRPGGLTFERVRALYESRLDYAPPFRRRLVEVPFGIHHPLWIEDPDFDLDWHLRHITLPADRQPLHDATDLAAKLVAIPLDRTRPLWEMWFIDGIEDGHDRPADQGAPRRHRRRVGRGADGRHPRPRARSGAPARARGAVDARPDPDRHRADRPRRLVAGAAAGPGGPGAAAHGRRGAQDPRAEPPAPAHPSAGTVHARRPRR